MNNMNNNNMNNMNNNNMNNNNNLNNNNMNNNNMNNNNNMSNLSTYQNNNMNGMNSNKNNMPPQQFSSPLYNYNDNKDMNNSMSTPNNRDYRYQNPSPNYYNYNDFNNNSKNNSMNNFALKKNKFLNMTTPPSSIHNTPVHSNNNTYTNNNQIPSPKTFSTTTSPQFNNGNNDNNYNNQTPSVPKPNNNSNTFTPTISKFINANSKPYDINTISSPHRKNRPTYASLIGQAIMSSPNHKAQLSTICDWIVDHYPTFDRSDQRWQNSIRHNLSLQKCFVKLPHSPDSSSTHSKSCFWTIHEDFLESFINGEFVRHRHRRINKTKDLSNLSPNNFMGDKKNGAKKMSSSDSKLEIQTRNGYE